MWQIGKIILRPKNLVWGNFLYLSFQIHLCSFKLAISGSIMFKNRNSDFLFKFDSFWNIDRQALQNVAYDLEKGLLLESKH